MECNFAWHVVVSMLNLENLSLSRIALFINVMVEVR